MIETETRSALIFTGQGYVEPGMGTQMRSTRIGDEMLQEVKAVMPDSPVVDLMHSGTLEDLMPTRVAQLATYIRGAYDIRERYPDYFHSYNDSHIATDGMAAVARFAAGLSLGEFTALYAAGALTFADGLRAVAFRGDVMQRLIESSASVTVMTAVTKMEGAEERVPQVCDNVNDRYADGDGEFVSVANFNGVEQIVIGGTEVAVGGVEEILRGETNSKRIKRVPVPAAFHTRVFQGAVGPLRRLLSNGVMLYDPIVPIIHNLDAQPNDTTDGIIEKASAQVARPVLFTDTIREMYSAGVSRVEIFGPGASNVGKMFLATVTDENFQVVAVK